MLLLLNHFVLRLRSWPLLLRVLLKFGVSVASFRTRTRNLKLLLFGLRVVLL